MKKLKTNEIIKCKKILLLFTFLIMLCSSTKMNAQNVTGVVVSQDDGSPLIGVTVLNSNSKKVTATDFDGQYSIVAKEGDLIKFTYLGMRTTSLKVKGTTLNVEMESEADALEEVVVVGYQKIKKKEVTGAVAQVKSEDIEKFVTTDVASALQGQVSGVSVIAASGEPGEQASIQIRGVTSISGSNEPLWVVDGIAQNGNPGLSPNEIETIDVLKDAASTAIYGAEGAAGVILVTTKQGKEGKMQITLNSSYGVQNLGRNLDLMNTRETLFYEQTRLVNGATPFAPGPVRNPEWINNDNTFTDLVLVDNAKTTQHFLNFSGGAKGFSYSSVLGYYKQEGTIVNSQFERINARISSAYRTENWKLNGSIAFTTDIRDRTGDFLVAQATTFLPYFPLLDPNSDVVFTDGNGGSQTPINNLSNALKRTNKINSDRINASLHIDRKIIDGLTLGATAGLALTNTNSHEFAPRVTEIDVTGTRPPEVDDSRSAVIMRNTRIATISADAGFKYNKKIANHKLGLQGLVAVKTVERKSFDAREQGVTNNSISNFFTTTVNPQVGSGTYDGRRNLTGVDYRTELLSYVGRATYSYKEKYLFSGIIRRDGFSAFPNNTWGNFPSVSLAWNITEEDFWQPYKSTVNNFKLRVSRGVVGNNRFNNIYAAFPTVAPDADYVFSPNDSEQALGQAVRQHANADLKWETSISDNIGVDLAFFKNKLTITADYYSTRREDMLQPVRLPGSSGVRQNGDNNQNLILNVGNMTNKGFELAARYRTRFKGLKLDVSGTFTTNENEITDLFGTDLIINGNSAIINGTQANATALIQGREVGAFYLYETDGVIKTEEELIEYKKLDPTARLGDLRYIDNDGDGVVKTDVDDKVYKGSALPDYEIGLNLKLDYKGFDFSTNWFASVGGEILNGNRANAYVSGRHKDLLNQWSIDNRNSNIPLNRGQRNATVNYVGDTDYWLEDGSYLRLRVATLGYTFSREIAKKLNISKLRIYLNAQNPLTFTNYKGFDPEIGGNVSRRGIDSSRYPLTSLYTVGLNLKF